MMIEKLAEDLKAALKAGDAFKVSVLRMATAAIKNKSIEKRSELSPEEVLQVLKSEVKKRNDAKAEYEKAGRADLSEKEASESALLKAYLPPEADDAAIEAAVRSAIEELGDDPKQIGKIVGAALKRLGGNASGDRVMAAAKKILGI